MYFSENQIYSEIAPENPSWEVEIKGAVSVKHLAEVPDGHGYILAMHADGESAEAKVLKISTSGEFEWELDYPGANCNSSNRKGYFYLVTRDQSGGTMQFHDFIW